MFGLPFRQLPQRKRRLLAFGVVVCWLMLNTQLALAAHLCDAQPVVQTTQVVSHHDMNMTQASHQTLYMILCNCHFSVVTVQAITKLDNKAAHRHAPVL